MPLREDYWNIGYPLFGALVYIVVPIAVAAIAFGFWRRWRMWRTGAPMSDLGGWGKRVRKTAKLVVLDTLGHRRFIRHELYPGVMHFALFWGVAVLLAATALTALEHNAAEYLGRELWTIQWRVQTGFVWDVFGGLVTAIGVGMAVWRRYVIRPERLSSVLDDGATLGLLALVLFSGFLLEGLRIGATELNPVSGFYAPASAPWSPVGYVFARALSGLGMEPGGMETAHAVTWWLHVGIVTAGTVYVALAFGKLSHIVAAPLNILLRPDRRCGVLRPMGDFEQLDTFGARDLPDLPWNQLLAFDACTNCGRCQDQCPAWASGKPLSPRKLMQDLRAYMEQRAPELLAVRPGETAPEPARSMVSDAAGEEALWSCTTCAACAKACPVFIEHVDTIVDMRRYLVLEEAKAPPMAQAALQNLEQRGHPWRGTTLSRTDWMAGLNVPTMAEQPGAEYLLWVGCTGALVDRCVEVTRAVVAVLMRAGVDFAVLGDEETCTGDPARRLGNEYLFQKLARANIETFSRYNVNKIITMCPHCYNTLRHEYRQLGGHYQVQHYSELVARLIEDGRLMPSENGSQGSVAYHDPCYLGRHNGVYDAPRQVLDAVPGLKRSEMKLTRDEALCCGGGGGLTWIDETGTRMSHVRMDHFLQTDAETLATTCPFCLQMFEEAVSAMGVEGSRRVRDVAEILNEALGPFPGA